MEIRDNKGSAPSWAELQGKLNEMQGRQDDLLAIGSDGDE